MKGLTLTKLSDEENTLGWDKIKIIETLLRTVQPIFGECEHGNPTELQ